MALLLGRTTRSSVRAAGRSSNAGRTAGFFIHLLACFGGAGITNAVTGIIAVGSCVLGRYVTTGASRRTGLGGTLAADGVAAGRSGTVGPARRMGFAVAVGQAGSIAIGTVFRSTFAANAVAGITVGPVSPAGGIAATGCSRGITGRTAFGRAGAANTISGIAV